MPDTDERASVKITNMESIIILAGEQNVGKTTTLREFAQDLLLDRNDSSEYRAKIDSFFNSHVHQSGNGQIVNDDLWLIIPTKKGNVFVATKGDNKDYTEANAAFFRQEYDTFHKSLARAKIYTFDTEGNDIEVKEDVKNFFPHKCFSGSRHTKSVMHPLLLCAKEQSFIGEGIIISMRAKIIQGLNIQRIERYKNVLKKLF